MVRTREAELRVCDGITSNRITLFGREPGLASAGVLQQLKVVAETLATETVRCGTPLGFR